MRHGGLQSGMQPMAQAATQFDDHMQPPPTQLYFKYILAIVGIAFPSTIIFQVAGCMSMSR
jgi:hypothetical protein